MNVIARAKCRRLDALAVVIDRARGERVAMRILHEAAARRGVASEAVHVRTVPLLETYVDDSLSRALGAAAARVREPNCDVSPRDRFFALRARIATRQHHARNGNVPYGGRGSSEGARGLAAWLAWRVGCVLSLACF